MAQGHPFDPAKFMHQQSAAGFSTEFTPVPVGIFKGIIEKIEETNFRMQEMKNPDTGQVENRLIFEPQWVLDDPDGKIKEATGRAKNSVRQSVFLDLDQSGKLEHGKGKNVTLGNILEALNLNDPSKPFAFPHLVGKPAFIEVEHREHEGRTFAQVKSVGRIGDEKYLESASKRVEKAAK